MSESQPGPEDRPGSQEWTTPEPGHTQPIPAPASEAADDFNDDFDDDLDEDAAGWQTPPPPPPPPGGPYPGGASPGAGYPGGGYPGAGYPGSAYPGGAYPGGASPSAGYPGGASPGAGYPGGASPGAGYPGSYPGGAYPGGGYPGSAYPGGAYPGGGYPGGGYPGGGYPGGYPGGWGTSGGRGAGRTARGTGVLIASVAIIAALIGAGIAYAARGSTPASNTSAAPPSSTLPGSGSGSGNQGQAPSGEQPGGSVVPGSGGPSDVSAIAAKVDPALVDVNVTFQYQDASGAGTGIVLTSNGEVLTNNHVIDGATTISVTDIGNGRTYGASVVGYDSTHDMAILQLTDASGLRTATISQSAPKVGEAVVAIGNAGGTGGTPTAAGGSITALNQSITASDSLDGTDEQLTGLIETNADVQSGDSGGSLVNSAGQVVGMDTAASTDYSFQSQSGTEGFAIPISQATTTARQIESGDASSVVHIGATAFLGVQVSTSDENSGGGFPGSGSGFPGSGSSGQGGSTVSGAVIQNVISGGAAAQAGLQEGDVITSLAGQSVTSPTALSKILVGYHPGDSITIGWTDTAGQSHTATVDLGSGPPA